MKASASASRSRSRRPCPSDLERVGDFSDTRNASGALIVIYDPFSTVASGSGFARTAFPIT